MNMLLNVGQLVIYFFLGLVLAFLGKLIYLVTFKSKFLAKVKMFILREIYFSFLLQLILQSYLEFTLNSLINFYQILTEESGDYFSAGCSVLFLLIIMAYPIFAWRLIYLNLRSLEDQEFSAKYASLYQDTNLKTLGRYYVLVFMVRRIIFSACAVFLVDHPAFQIFLTTLVSLFIAIYILVVSPFAEKA
mmetsp:Transcript_42844/g.41167  ORF Transcript_42844/g.41167 Transcript_42844/m.41167 type:complete len:190 (-) Transcript_42844:912-1481(-)